IDFEKIHPLETGIVRKKFRRDRRPIFPMEPVWRFYPRYFSEVVVKSLRWATRYASLRRRYVRIKRNPLRYQYMDTAMTPVADSDTQTCELFQSDAARAYIAQQQRLDKVRHGEPV